nr:neurogenic locus notch (notch) [Hymenolepis microstoma]
MPISTSQNNMWLALWLCFAPFIYPSYSKNTVGIYISLTDYSNPSDKTYRGQRCDYGLFHWFDLCDPQFTITVNGRWGPERYKTIISHITPTYDNSKHIYSVYSSRGELESLPRELDFTIEVNDIDAKTKMLINEFYYKFSVNSTTDQTVKFEENIRLTLNFKLYCLNGFYGPRCEVECASDQPDWSCHSETGTRVCMLPCDHGDCVASESGKAICQCFEGYSGHLCNIPDYPANTTVAGNYSPLIIGATVLPLFLLSGVAILILVFYRKRKTEKCRFQNILSSICPQQKKKLLDIPLCVYSRQNNDLENCQGSSLSSSTLAKTGDTISERHSSPVRAFQRSQLPPTPPECGKLGIMENNSVYEDIDNDVYLDPKTTDTYSQLPIPPSPRF